MEIWLLRIAIGTVLIAIGIQDLRWRGVSWYLFPLLVLLLRMDGPVAGMQEVLINVGFVLLVFLLLTLWFFLRQGRVVNIFSTHIGYGDLLFLLCLCAYLSPLSFFLFYLLSLLAITLGVGIYRLFKKAETFTIPLAGLQGFLFIGTLCFHWTTGFGIQQDDLINYFL